nr:group II intron reverse transcriptase/maturase [Rhodomonas sp. NIES-1730]
MDISILDTSWSSLPWKEFQIKLFQLQNRIYKAVLNGNIKDAIKFQKILLKSKASHFIAVRDISKKSVTKDQIFTNSLNKFISISKVHYELNINSNKKIKRNYANFITLEDEIICSIYQYALEPAYKASLFKNYSLSRLFKRSWKIQKKIKCNDLSKNGKSFSIPIYKESLFNKRKSEYLLENIIFPLKYKLKLLILLKLKTLTINKFNKKTDFFCNVSFPLVKSMSSYRIDTIYFTNNTLDGSSYVDNIKNLYDSSRSINDLLNFIRGFVFQIEIRSFEPIFSYKSVNYHLKKKWEFCKNKIKSILKICTHPFNTRLKKANKTFKKWYFQHKYNYYGSSKRTLQMHSLEIWCSRYIKKNTKKSSYCLKDLFKKEET